VSVRVQLIGKPGCHLCETARVVIDDICTDLKIEWEELSIHDSAELADQYGEFIPVVLIDGKQHDQFGVSETRLRRALLT